MILKIKKFFFQSLINRAIRLYFLYKLNIFKGNFIIIKLF